MSALHCPGCGAIRKMKQEEPNSEYWHCGFCMRAWQIIDIAERLAKSLGKKVAASETFCVIEPEQRESEESYTGEPVILPDDEFEDEE